MSKIPTPCVKICTLDAARGYCLGCERSVAEIARWATMSDDERRKIMDELPARAASRNGATPQR